MINLVSEVFVFVSEYYILAKILQNATWLY